MSSRRRLAITPLALKRPGLPALRAAARDPQAGASPHAPTVAARVYFFFGVLAGLFPAYVGLTDPAKLDRAFSWASLPPLHARFVGAFYLFAVLYTLGLLLARHRWQVGSGFLAVTIFTGVTGILNAINLDAFDFDETTVRIWIAVYIVFPIVGLALAYAHHDDTQQVEHGRPIGSWARAWLLVQAGVYAAVGALLLFAREAAADAWPWAVSETLAQFYGGAFLGLAYVSWHSARRRVWAALAAVVPAFFVFAVVTIVVSLVHGELFDGSDPAAWAWFAFFGASAAALAAMLAIMLRPLVGERRRKPVA
jgi:hypothetical protein